jgi:hypothetical protein
VMMLSRGSRPQEFAWAGSPNRGAQAGAEVQGARLTKSTELRRATATATLAPVGTPGRDELNIPVLGQRADDGMDGRTVEGICW